MNPIEMFENPAMAEQRRINQLLFEQQQFWFPFNAHPPSNDAERQEAIQVLMQRYGQLSVLQGDAMFLDTQGYGRLLSLVRQQLNAILSARNQYLSSLQGPLPGFNVESYQPPKSPLEIAEHQGRVQADLNEAETIYTQMSPDRYSWQSAADKEWQQYKPEILQKLGIDPELFEQKMEKLRNELKDMQ